MVPMCDHYSFIFILHHTDIHTVNFVPVDIDVIILDFTRLVVTIHYSRGA